MKNCALYNIYTLFLFAKFGCEFTIYERRSNRLKILEENESEIEVKIVYIHTYNNMEKPPYRLG